MRRPLSALLLALAAVSSAVAPAARADDTDACIRSYEQAQRLRKDGRLRASREELLSCSRPTCPKVTRRDCVPWLQQVEDALPTVVFAVRTSGGRDVADVRVSIDGTLVATRLDGKPVAVDPGMHELRFERDGDRPLEQSLLVSEGQKNREVAAVLEPLAPPRDDTQPAPPKKSPPVLALVVGGLGLAITGVGAYFDIRGFGHAEDLRACTPVCPTSQRDTARTELLVGDVALGVGIVATAVAVWLFLTHRDDAAAPAVGRVAASQLFWMQ